MNWIEIIIHTTNEAIEPISNILNDAGANGVVIVDPSDLTKEKRSKFGELYELNESHYPTSGVLLKAYFLNNDEWSIKKETIQENITNLQQYEIDIGLNKMITREVQEEDWENEWKKYFKPIAVTDRLTIVPSWETYQKQHDDELMITIDPGMAFGTGTHPTTVLSMMALEKVVQKNDIVLDVGSGSGVLSIAAILLSAHHVYAYDLDEVAVNSTIINRDMNHFEENITVKQNDLLTNVHQKANIIVSNILADILLQLIDDAWNLLENEGYFITSGIIKSKEQMVKEALENKGFFIEKTNELDNWISFIAIKSNKNSR